MEELSSEERVCVNFILILFQAVLCARLVLLAPPCEYNEVFDGEDPKIQKKLAIMEPWRHSLEDHATNYVAEHFANGAVSVYLTDTQEDHRIILCTQADLSKHQSTGRWRSEWSVKKTEQSLGKEFTVHGIIKLQTHLYEEGNVQLISSKEVDFVLTATKPSEFATECMKRIAKIDYAYQIAIGENFKTMSDTTFKALRRQLPLTRSKIDWNKIITYQVGNEISRSPP